MSLFHAKCSLSDETVLRGSPLHVLGSPTMSVIILGRSLTRELACASGCAGRGRTLLRFGRALAGRRALAP